ncbi:hypothetical protein V9L05_01555 [Bernardetia sp. Wsw4-3y2]|uniref:hypothetical protein n=1 Tax=Bernardetia sp. Wsw4-3y2 TaxID=3127471 RepID=UPI0030CC28BF
MKTAHILIAATVVAGGAGFYVATTENEKIKKLIGKGKIEPVKTIPPKTNTSYNSGSSYSSASGITSRSSKADIIRLQQALIAAGHLPATQKTKSGATVSSADGIWGTMTSTALAKAGLSSPVTEVQLNSIKKGSSSSSSVNESHADIASYIAKEMRSFTTNYDGILSKLKDKTSSEIKSIDAAYRQYSSKGLKKDFETTDKGGKVSWDTLNSQAIRDILNDSGLSGVGYGMVRTRKTCTIQDPKGNVVVGKDVILGKVIAKEKHPNGKVYIQTINGGQVIANPRDLIDHN